MTNFQLYQELVSLLQSIDISSTAALRLIDENCPSGNSVSEQSRDKWHIHKSRINADLCKGVSYCMDVESQQGLCDQNAELYEVFSELLEEVVK